uniref:Glycosyltransferase n=1 Tax=Prevotella sp. GTC17259 TaxID=3236795 RepID=A0AB33JAL9_9BACT
MEMKVSIIVPIYNVEKYIASCLESVMKQTYYDIECILVNDHTPDNSLILAKQCVVGYQGNINFILLEHEENKGLSEARNTGVRASTGEYMFFLDSDDRITEDCIERLVKTAQEAEFPEIVMGITKGVDERGRLVEVSDAQTKSFVTNEEVFQGYINNGWYVIGCNKLIRRDIFDKHQTYFFSGLYHEDVMWSFEVATYIRSLILCPYTTYLYYIGDMNSISRSVWGAKKVSDSITILEKKAEYINRVSNEALLLKHIKNECYNIVYSLFRHKYSLSEIRGYLKRIRVLMTINGMQNVKSDVPLYRKIIYNIYNYR